MSLQTEFSGGLGRRVGSRVPSVLRRHATAFGAAIVIGIGFAGLTMPMVWSAGHLQWIPLSLEQVLLLLLAGCSAWLMLWIHARTLHVERLLARGLEVDEPAAGLAAQRRDLRGLML